MARQPSRQRTARRKAATRSPPGRRALKQKRVAALSWTPAQIAALRSCLVGKVERWVASGDVTIDCADLAVTALAECAHAQSLALTVPVWDAASSRWITLRSADYPTLDKYTAALRANIGAVNLFDRDRVTGARALDAMEPGDLVLYDLRAQENPAYTGHTMVVLSNDPAHRSVRVGEGHLSRPPEITTYTYTELAALFQHAGTPIPPVGGKGRVWNWSAIAG